MTTPTLMRSPLAFVASLLLISAAGAVEAPTYSNPPARPAGSTSPLSAPEITTSRPTPVRRIVTRLPGAGPSSTLARIGSPRASTLRTVDRTAADSRESSAASSISAPEAPQPILRGVTLIEGGNGRAYIEDPRTGKVAGYALGDTFADSRIERIQVDRVVLRNRHGIVQLPLGAPATAMPDHPHEADTPSQRLTDAPSASPSSGQLSAIRPEPGVGQIIGNGQAWLDRLGIPRGALSRAIESALPAQESNDLDD